MFSLTGKLVYYDLCHVSGSWLTKAYASHWVSSAACMHEVSCNLLGHVIIFYLYYLHAVCQNDYIPIFFKKSVLGPVEVRELDK